MASLSPPATGLHASCGPNYSPPLRRFARDSLFRYQVQAFPTSKRKHTVVYITTSCHALVTFILGAQWAPQLDVDQYLNYTGINSTWSDADEENIAMRILRVGGAVLDTTYIRQHEYYADRDEQSQLSAGRSNSYSAGQKMAACGCFTWTELFFMSSGKNRGFDAGKMMA